MLTKIPTPANELNVTYFLTFFLFPYLLLPVLTWNLILCFVF